MNPVVVVAAQVRFELSLKTGDLAGEVAGEGRLPALLHPPEADRNSFERNSEALSFITASSFPRLLERSLATFFARRDVHLAEGLRGVVCSSAQVDAEPTSIAVYCHTVPLTPESLPA